MIPIRKSLSRPSPDMAGPLCGPPGKGKIQRPGPGRDRVPIMEVSLPTTITFEVYIDPDRCGKSLVCIDMCSMGVFMEKDGYVYPWNSHLCCSCFKCNEFCPNHAISTRWIIRA